jgi:hypothetical protein
MVVRSVLVLGSAILVGTSPTWLNLVASLWGISANPHGLPFSPYWIAVPGAVCIGISWVFEMGANESPNLQSQVPAGGFDWTKPPSENPERRAAPRQSSAAGTTPGAASVWRRLETDFREILEFGADLDATWERTSTYTEAAESWRLSGVYEEARIEKKFTELANTAGRMLVEWPGYTPPLSASTARQSNPRDRWLCTLRDREIKSETWAPGQVLQNDAVTGHVHGGAIRDVIEASIELCVQLTLEESLGDRTSATAGSLGARLIDAERP